MPSKTFQGFAEGNGRFTPIPNRFFDDLLLDIDHLGELKITLYLFWQLSKVEKSFRFLRMSEIIKDKLFMKGMGDSEKTALHYLEESIQKAVHRGTMIGATIDLSQGQETLYFINSPRGRAAVEAISRGEWKHSGDPMEPVELTPERPNIYLLYEENIGPLTPMIAESLGNAERTYPDFWIQDALRVAVENNKRNWRYVEAILDRWQKEGRDEREDRQATEKDRRRYIEGEFSDLIEH